MGRAPSLRADIPQNGVLGQAKKSPFWGATTSLWRVSIPKMGNRLKTLRNDRRWTQQEAADAMGISRGQYIKLERDERRLNTTYIALAAKAFGVSESQVIAKTSTVIPVVGLISAGGTIETAWEQQSEPLHEIEIPFPLGEDVIGLVVNGDSMWPKYDPGDVIVVSRSGESIEGLVGWEAAVRTADGNRYFKRLICGARKGLFDLESYNAPTIRGVEIEWAAGRIATIPASRWKRIVSAGLKSISKPGSGQEARRKF